MWFYFSIFLIAGTAAGVAIILLLFKVAMDAGIIEKVNEEQEEDYDGEDNRPFREQ